MKVLVAYGSKYGSTREIAEVIGRELTGYGLKVDVLPTSEVQDLDSYDGFVIGSAIYGGYWRRDASSLVHDFATKFLGKPTWLFSSGPVGMPERPSDPDGEGDTLVQVIEARGHQVFAGKLDPDKLNFGERAIVRGLRAPTGDYRDLDEVARWGRRVGQDLLKAFSHSAKSSTQV